jgi:hypothetical protein
MAGDYHKTLPRESIVEYARFFPDFNGFLEDLSPAALPPFSMSANR